jgi:hypothetical protein
VMPLIIEPMKGLLGARNNRVKRSRPQYLNLVVTGRSIRLTTPGCLTTKCARGVSWFNVIIFTSCFKLKEKKNNKFDVCS